MDQNANEGGGTNTQKCLSALFKCRLAQTRAPAREHLD